VPKNVWLDLLRRIGPVNVVRRVINPKEFETISFTDCYGASGVSTQLNVNGNICRQLKASPNGHEFSHPRRKSKYFVINGEDELGTFERVRRLFYNAFVIAGSMI